MAASRAREHWLNCVTVFPSYLSGGAVEGKPGTGSPASANCPRDVAIGLALAYHAVRSLAIDVLIGPDQAGLQRHYPVFGSMTLSRCVRFRL